MQTQQRHVHKASHAHTRLRTPISHFPPLSLSSLPSLLSFPPFPIIISSCTQHLSIHRGRLRRGTPGKLLFLPISPPLIHCLPDCREIQRQSSLPEMRYPSCNNSRTRASQFSRSLCLPYQIGSVSPGLLALLSFGLSRAISPKVCFYEWLAISLQTQRKAPSIV